jgi:predicted metalloprotease with PDZ domain
VATALAGPPAAGDVEYTLCLQAAHTQSLTVRMRLESDGQHDLDLQMPVWRPGRYAVHDPAGSVRRLQARAETGRDLRVEKVDKATWRIHARGARAVTVEYDLYANALADRTRHADDTHAFVSGESVFLYDPAQRSAPVVLRIEAPQGWEVATGLEPHPTEPAALVAPDYDTLIDCPLEIGLHERLEFEARGVPHQIVLWPAGAAIFERQALRADVSRIVETVAALFGDLPYTRYVFLVHVGTGAAGGTEHRNSTIMQTSRRGLEDPDAYRRFLGLVSHEFFHTYNVKQFRPADLHPYDYQRENYTRLLWVVEGTTSYYDDLVLVRCGLLEPRRYLERLGESIAALRDRPGAAVQSLEESSFDAWIKHNRPSPDAVNATVSFYDKGALVSLALDAEIRRHSQGAASLDEVMRQLYRRFPAGGPGYTTEALLQVIEGVARANFAPFFERFVAGTGPLPFEEALATFGLELRAEPVKDAEPGAGPPPAGEAAAAAAPPATSPQAAPYVGLDLHDEGGRALVRAVRSDGPAHGAGVIAGDEIVALDGRRVRAGEWDELLRLHQPGRTVRLHLFRHDGLRAVDVTLAGRPRVNLRVRRVADPSAAQRRAYESWLGQPWPAAD